MASAKWRQFCLRLNVLTHWYGEEILANLSMISLFSRKHFKKKKKITLHYNTMIFFPKKTKDPI